MSLWPERQYITDADHETYLLPLEPVTTPPLYEAYERTPSINTRYSFEQAQSKPVLALVLRLYAEAIVKQRSKAA